MSIPTFIFIIGAAWLLQYGLTFVQIRHYRSMLGKILDDFKDKPNYHLFSGVSRKPFSAGGIVAIVVDSDFEIHQCYVMSGYTVFSRFRTYRNYDGQHIGQLLADANDRLNGEKQSFDGKKSMARAFKMAAENAVHSIANKRTEMPEPSQIQTV